MGFILGMIIGGMLGATVGIGVMALLVAARRADEVHGAMQGAAPAPLRRAA